jgi:probable HAF family extracellular repeat protein
MFDRAPTCALVSLLAALIGLAGCAGNGNSSQMIPGSTMLGKTTPNRTRTATSTAAYSLTDLCPLAKDAPCEVGKGGYFFFALGDALNNSGQGAGTSTDSGEEPTATLFQNGKLKNLNTLGAMSSEGMAINASGQVAGMERPSSDPVAGHAFLYSNGKMTDIENSSLFPNGSQAYGINKAGQVVGVGLITGDEFHAFLYSGGKMVDLDPFGGVQSWATSINDSGEIIGSACCLASGAAVTTWLYANGTFTKLSETNSGLFINNNGQIVGVNSSEHAALYSNGSWTDLGGFEGHATEALGINTSGQIVGFALILVKNKKCPSCGEQDESRGLIFTSSGPVDLNTLIPSSSGFTIREAIAIDDSGQIVADAENSSGVFHAVLLTPN